MKKLREAEQRRQGEVESLRKNADELRRQLKESIDTNDQIVQAAKAHELEHEQLVGGLIREAERVNELILGKRRLLLFDFLLGIFYSVSPA